MISYNKIIEKYIINIIIYFNGKFVVFYILTFPDNINQLNNPKWNKFKYIHNDKYLLSIDNINQKTYIKYYILQNKISLINW